MSSDILRRAAERLEELAGAATPGPWRRYGMAGVATPETEVVYEGPIECGECDWRVAVTGCLTNDDALLIATLADPRVGLALAAWLRDTATLIDNPEHGLLYDGNAADIARQILGEVQP